jgi:hypothetical protein
MAPPAATKIGATINKTPIDVKINVTFAHVGCFVSRVETAAKDVSVADLYDECQGVILLNAGSARERIYD